MSGSPKYSHASLAAEQERRIAEQSRQRAQADERRRRQREAEEQQRQLEQSRSQLLQQWTQRRGLIATHRESSYGRFVAAAWPQLTTELEAALGACERARSIDQMQAARQQIEALDRELAAAAARARVLEQTERLRQQLEQRAAELTTTLMLLHGELSAMDSALAAKLDPGGATIMRATLQQSRELLDTKQMDAAERGLEKARAALLAHKERIRRGLAEKAAARAAAESALAGLQSQLSALDADEVVMTWCRIEMAMVVDQCAQAATALADEQFSATAEGCQHAAAAISALLQKAEQRQLEEERRSYLVNSLVEVLRQQEFLVGEPQLAAGSDLDSTVVIHATRPDRRSILLQIPKSGPVAYDVDGYEKRIEGDPSGLVATCDEAEARLVAIHTQLEADFGIQMGELYWEGRDPQRKSRDSLLLPSGAAQTRQRGH